MTSFNDLRDQYRYSGPGVQNGLENVFLTGLGEAAIVGWRVGARCIAETWLGGVLVGRKTGTKPSEVHNEASRQLARNEAVRRWN